MVKSISVFLVLICLVSFAKAQIDGPVPQKEILHKITWKKTFDWKLISITGSEFTSSMLDIHYTLVGERKGCALEQGENGPYRATRGDLLKKNLPMDAGVIVSAILLRKIGMPVGWLAGPSVGIVKHSQAIYQWHQYCSY